MECGVRGSVVRKSSKINDRKAFFHYFTASIDCELPAVVICTHVSDNSAVCVPVKPHLCLSSFTSLRVGISGRAHERNQGKTETLWGRDANSTKP